MAVPDEYSGPTFEFGGERFPFEPTELMGSDVKLLKSRTGLTFMKYVKDLEEDLGAEALGFYVWLTLTRAGKEPGKYSEFDFNYGELVSSLEGFDDEADAEPDPTPTRAKKRASSRKSASGGRSSRTTAEASPLTGS